MIKKRLPIFIATAFVCAPVLAENPADKPVPEEEILKQVEALHPVKTTGTPAPSTPRFSINAAAPTALSTGATQLQLNGPSNATGPATIPPAPSVPGTPGIGPKQPLDRSSILAPGATGPDAKPTGPDGQEQQQPTEITATEATFNQKTNIGVFLIDVFVKDPQFNLWCDKLTAYLKQEDATPAGAKPAPGAKATPGAKGAATPKATAATPAAATPAAVTPTGSPKPGTTAATGTPAPVRKKSGLDKAIAVTTSDRRVIITQDKVETDGTITHSIGISDRAEYFADTGDVFLYGMPDVTQGTNRCIATATTTWMKLTRDGRMEAHGPHKTIIVDTDRQNRENTGNGTSQNSTSQTAPPAPSPR